MCIFIYQLTLDFPFFRTFILKLYNVKPFKQLMGLYTSSLYLFCNTLTAVTK